MLEHFFTTHLELVCCFKTSARKEANHIRRCEQGHRAGPVLPLGSPSLAHPVHGAELNDLAPRAWGNPMNCKQLPSDDISYFISLFHTPPFLPEPRTIAMCRASAFGHHCRAVSEKFLAMVRGHGSWWAWTNWTKFWNSWLAEPNLPKPSESSASLPSFKICLPVREMGPSHRETGDSMSHCG